MSNYTRQASFQAGELIDAQDFEDEFNAVQVAVNSKADPDGTIQEGLVAEFIAEDTNDTQHQPSEDGGTAANGEAAIPLCNGTLQTNLNAEMLGGLEASEISGAAFPSGTRMVFAQAAPPAGWTKVVINSLANRDPILIVGDGKDTGGDGTQTQSGYSLTDGDIPVVGSNTPYFWGISTLEGLNPHVTIGQTDTVTMTASDIPLHTHKYDKVNTVTTPVNPGAASNVPLEGTNVINTSVNEPIGPASWPHSHQLEGQLNTSWRPPHMYVVIAERD